VTLPVHPLKEKRLPVLAWVRGQDGRRYVDAEHPRGWTIRLPLEWTDRCAALMPPSLNGHEVRLAVPGLLELARAIEVALVPCQEAPQRGAEENAEPPRKPRHASPQTRPAAESELVHAPRPTEARRSRCLGHPRAQGTSSRGKARRGQP
jgi:hypothetical protein